MHPSSVPALPRRDKIAILLSLSGVTLLAWASLLDIAAGMDKMPAMSMSSATQTLMVRVWTGRDFVLMFLMWAVMMVGMMVPTAAPMTLIYAAVARKADAQQNPVAPTGVFIAGYVAVWTLFSLATTAT